MNNNQLDILLNELKRVNTSLDYNEFCNKQWGKSTDTFRTCRLLAQTLVDDGHATFTPNNSDRIIITGKGAQFKGYVQQELDAKAATNAETEMEQLRRTNLILSNEKFEYEKTIRKLEEELKISTLLKNWWWLIAACVGLGIAIGKFIIK